MPLGLNREGDFHKGNPVPPTNPSFTQNIVNWIKSAAHFGNPVPPVDPTTNSNPVDWPTPDPAHFGNTGQSK